MEHEQSTEHPLMQCGSAPEFLKNMTEEQKKKIALMVTDLKIQWIEVKISDMEKMIALKKKAIADIKQVQEMIKQGK
jgi:hypothetical protein